MFVDDFAGEFKQYRAGAEKAMSQVSDAALNHIVAPDGNSIAMIARHVSGNLVSRFTDFLTTDGEKPDRDREGEFADGPYSRAEIHAAWARGWGVLEAALADLRDEDLIKTITIRGKPLTVHAALCRSVSHQATHVGQIVLLARILASADWQWISIPKGQSEVFNKRMAAETPPGA